MTKSELENCIAEYGRDIYAFCRALTPDRQEAEELYQDTFLLVVEKMESVKMADSGGNPKSYLLSVALRLWKNKRRKYAWRKSIAPQQTAAEVWEQAVETADGGTAVCAAGTGGSPEEDFLRQERERQVRRAVDGLPGKQRLTVYLYYMEELDCGEIARLLRIPEGTVKSRLFQARKRLKRELECFYDE